MGPHLASQTWKRGRKRGRYQYREVSRGTARHGKTWQDMVRHGKTEENQSRKREKEKRKKTKPCEAAKSLRIRLAQHGCLDESDRTPDHTNRSEPCCASKASACARHWPNLGGNALEKTFYKSKSLDPALKPSRRSPRHLKATSLGISWQTIILCSGFRLCEGASQNIVRGALALF